MKTINLIILVFLTTTVGLYQNTYANVFHVADGRQLSMAFSEASSNGENDIIYLAEGIYKGEFVFQTSEANSLTITSEPELKAEQVIFDGEEMVRPLYISGDVEANFLIEKISIRNGNVEDSGGGLYIKTEGKITIRSCNLTDNSATHGDGGGIYANASGDIVFIGNNISGNSSFMSTSNSETVSNGGGIYAVSTTKINFIKNTIIKNITTSSSTSTTDYYAESIAKGGGVYASAEDISFTNNTITKNISTSLPSPVSLHPRPSSDGGGVYLNSNGKISFSGNDVIENNSNTTNSNGGGVYFDAGNIYFTNNTFSKNTVGYQGGGVYLFTNGNVIFLMNRIIQNSSISKSKTFGGGVYVYGHTIDRDQEDKQLSFSNNAFINNIILFLLMRMRLLVVEVYM